MLPQEQYGEILTTKLADGSNLGDNADLIRGLTKIANLVSEDKLVGDKTSTVDTANIQSQINTAIASGVWDQGVGEVYYNSGNVGIGTDNPANKFEVVGGSMLVKPGDAVNAIQFHAGTGNTNHTNSIEWYNSSGTKRVLVASFS